MDSNLLAQIFGLFSFVLGTLCFYQKNDTKFKYFMLLLNINHTIHFVLLNATISALTSFLSIFRTAFTLKTKSKRAAYCFMLSVVGLSTFWAQHWYDWLAVAGSCVGTYGLFCLSGIKMRIFMFIGAICWLCNNLIVGSIGGVMLELFVIAVNTSTMYRIYHDNLKLQNTQQANLSNNSL